MEIRSVWVIQRRLDRSRKKGINTAPPKDVLAVLNPKLRAAGGSTVTAWKIAKAMTIHGLAPEVCDLMNDIEHAIVVRQ
jgi:hypothetical protein